MLAGIQYLRAVAAILVVFDHAEAIAAKEKYYGAYAFGQWFAGGAVGVDIFFVLSGFIIAYVTLSSNDLSPRLGFSEFIRRRFNRIIPFMWICIISYAALRYFARGDFDFWSAVRALTLWPIGEVMPKQIWTLRHEFLFYFVFGLCFIRFGGFYSRLFCVLYLASPLVVLTYYPQHLSTGWVGELAEFLFSGFNLLFLFGLVLGCWVRRKSNLPVINLGFMYFLLMGCSLALICRWIGYDWNNPFVILGIGVICTAMVFLGVITTSGGEYSKVNKLGLILGNASFSIYLTHDTFLSAIFGFLSSGFLMVDVRIVVLLGALSSILGGIVVYYYVEIKIIGLFSKFNFNNFKVVR